MCSDRPPAEAPEPSRTAVYTWTAELISCGFPRVIAGMVESPLAGEPYFDDVRRAIRTDALTVYLFGTNGNGKTHMGSWLLSMWHLIGSRAYAEAAMDVRTLQYPPTCRWASCNEITAALKNYSKRGFDFERELAYYASFTCLLIDDLWPDRVTEADVASIVELVEIRRNARRRTVITSNHEARALVGISRRLTDRLAEGVTIKFTGASHRTRK